MIGVKVGTAVQAGGTQAIRTLGRVAVDEMRVYRVTAAGDGWLREVLPVTVGSLVKKGQTLASFYAREFLAAQQGYLYALRALDRFEADATETPEQIKQTNINIQSARESLENLGMSERQIEEIGKSRRACQEDRRRRPRPTGSFWRETSISGSGSRRGSSSTASPTCRASGSSPTSSSGKGRTSGPDRSRR